MAFLSMFRASKAEYFCVMLLVLRGVGLAIRDGAAYEFNAPAQTGVSPQPFRNTIGLYSDKAGG